MDLQILVSLILFTDTIDTYPKIELHLKHTEHYLPHNNKNTKRHVYSSWYKAFSQVAEHEGPPHSACLSEIYLPLSLAGSPNQIFLL